MARFQNLTHRAWFAWQCLPREPDGQPPNFRPLERKVGLSNAVLRKVVRGYSPKPGFETLHKVAQALATTPEWLAAEQGAPPTTSNQIGEWPGMPKKQASKAVSDADLDSEAKERQRDLVNRQSEVTVAPEKQA